MPDNFSPVWNAQSSSIEPEMPLAELGGALCRRQKIRSFIGPAYALVPEGIYAALMGAKWQFPKIGDPVLEGNQ